MPRRTDNLYGNFNAARPEVRRSSWLLRASLEWIAVALVLAAGTAIVLFWLD